MFKKIEELYKKESSYNKITRKAFKLYICIFVVVWIFGLFSHFLYGIPIAFIMIISMKKICEKELEMKFYFKVGKKSNEEYCVSDAIKDQELNLFRKYVKDNNIYNKESLKNIVEHYRLINVSKTKSNNFLTILSILISILIPFLNRDNFEINNISITISYIIGIILLYGMIYWSYKQTYSLTKSLSGEDGMYERLEEIFSELLNEKNIEEIKKENKKTLPTIKEILYDIYKRIFTK